ncbi:MAG: hypothetical protein KGD67_05770 [Candidatus Lokiarchaeota archaeon]|nr:hypothetical protein [Candidatus Lokiarchaeota archaeon]
MLMLSVLSGLIGSATLGTLIGFCTFGIYFYYISKKTHIKLLSIMGISLFFAGFSYLGICADFLSILITGDNINSIILAFLIWPFVPISFLIIFYVAAEILVPKKKILIIIIYAILCIIFELSIFLDTLGNITFIEPTIPGGELIDDSLTFGSPASFIGIIFTLTGFFFNGFGLFFKGIRSSGVVGRKYKQLAIGYLIINVSALLDFIGIAEIIVIVRVASLISIWFFYLGLREEPEMREKKEKKKEIKIEGSLFRLTKRPDNITEEEITYYKEQKICMICKGKVSGFNIFLCPSCETIYHEECARALINSENTCWVCNGVIDNSKPSKPFKIESNDKEPIKIKK